MAEQARKVVSEVEQPLPKTNKLPPRLVIDSNTTPIETATETATETAPSPPVQESDNTKINGTPMQTSPDPPLTTEASASASAPASASGSGSHGLVEPVGLAEEVRDALEMAVLKRMITECSFHVHREAKLGFLSESSRSNQDIFGNTKSSVNKLFCQCPVCQRSVGAARFAPHLDKCIQRSSRVKPSRYNDSLAAQQPGKRGSATSRAGGSKRCKSTLGALRKAGTSRRAASPVVHTVSNANLACWTCKHAVKGSDVFICFGCDRASHARCVNLANTTRWSPTYFCRFCSKDIVEEVNGKADGNKATVAQNYVESWLKTSRSHLEKGGGVAPLLPLEFYCDSCDKLIPPGAHRWRCLECKNYDICETCLRAGVEKEQHKASHHRIKLAVRKPV